MKNDGEDVVLDKNKITRIKRESYNCIQLIEEYEVKAHKNGKLVRVMKCSVMDEPLSKSFLGLQYVLQGNLY